MKTFMSIMMWLKAFWVEWPNCKFAVSWVTETPFNPIQNYLSIEFILKKCARYSGAYPQNVWIGSYYWLIVTTRIRKKFSPKNILTHNHLDSMIRMDRPSKYWINICVLLKTIIKRLSTNHIIIQNPYTRIIRHNIRWVFVISVFIYY